MSIPIKKLQNCPKCGEPLSGYDFDYHDSVEEWEQCVDTFSVTCHNCDAYFWAKIPYIVDEENVEIVLEREE